MAFTCSTLMVDKQPPEEFQEREKMKADKMCEKVNGNGNDIDVSVDDHKPVVTVTFTDFHSFNSTKTIMEMRGTAKTTTLQPHWECQTSIQQRHYDEVKFSSIILRIESLLEETIAKKVKFSSQNSKTGPSDPLTLLTCVENTGQQLQFFDKAH